MRTLLPSSRVKIILIALLVLLAGASLVYNQILIDKIMEQERANVELWAKAFEHNNDPVHQEVSDKLNTAARSLRDYPEVPDSLPRMILEAESAKITNDFVIYVGASLYEPFGLAPLEAAQRGCALVLSDIGSFRELWDDCALFFDPGDSVALAATLGALMDDAGARHALAARASERARQRFGVERMVNEYRSLYSALPRTRISACA